MRQSVCQIQEAFQEEVSLKLSFSFSALLTLGLTESSRAVLCLVGLLQPPWPLLASEQ